MQRGNGAVIGKQNTPTTSVATGVWALNEVQRAVLGGNWPASTIVDPYFENVSLLLHGNGTNGAQNNTFLDSSTNNFTITRNGNTTQGTFTPYGDNWSNYFPSNSALSFNYTSGIALGSTYTIECWINPSDVSQGLLFNMEQSLTGGYAYLYFTLGPGGTIGAFVRPSTGGTEYGASAGVVVANVWQHVAVVNNAGTAQLYLNGVAVGTTFSMPAMSTTPSFVAIGQRANGFSPSGTYYTGYISNMRITTSVVYTGNFTPSTSPFPALANTKLLTCQSNRFVDNSTNAYALTVSSTSVQRFSPFNPTTPYAAGTIGGSGYFDGSGDFLALPASQTGLALSNSDFTFEAWVYRTSGTSAAFMLNGQGDGATVSGSSYAFLVGATGNSDLYVGSSVYSATNPNPPVGAWAHVAYVRTGGTFSTYLNGSRVGTVGTVGTGSVNAGSTTYVPSIGASSAGNTFLTGYIAGARLIKGSGGYDATQTTITVPTAPPTAVTNTQLLCNFTNGGIIDNAMMNDLETVGNAQISTSVSRFGGGSLAFNGSGSYLSAPSSRQYEFGTGDFTIEGWIYLTSATGAYRAIVSLPHSSGSVGLRFGNAVDYNSLLQFFVTGNTASVVYSINKSQSQLLNTWTHFAFTRQGTTCRVFVNGIQENVGSGTNVTSFPSASFTDSTNITGNTGAEIGRGGSADTVFVGNMDDLRITKGYARYTATFTPPTAPFPDQ